MKDGYYRLWRPTPRVVYLSNGEVEEVGDARPLPLPGGRGIVHLPCIGLFNDLLPDEVYPRTQNPARKPELRRKLDFALALLAADLPDLFDDFIEAISTIVLVPDWPPTSDGTEDREGNERWSFNLRFRYFGGIFLNLHRVGGFGALEGLVHEYCHQRLWLWWEVDRPSGIPHPSLTMVSPVTGLNRSVAVMVHALVIYQALADIYRMLLDRISDTRFEEASWVAQRHDKLMAGIPLLIDILKRHLQKGTVLWALVDWVAEHRRRHCQSKLA